MRFDFFFAQFEEKQNQHCHLTRDLDHLTSLPFQWFHKSSLHRGGQVLGVREPKDRSYPKTATSSYSLEVALIFVLLICQGSAGGRGQAAPPAQEYLLLCSAGYYVPAQPSEEQQTLHDHLE
jgi:hypothetical protein